jgi:hypothetical protein
MSAEAAAAVRTWRAGRHVCTLTMRRPVAGQAMFACIEWEPRPTQRLSAEDMSEYRAGRDAALVDVCVELGLRAAVVEA